MGFLSLNIVVMELAVVNAFGRTILRKPPIWDARGLGAAGKQYESCTPGNTNAILP